MRENKQGCACTPVKQGCACCPCKAGLWFLAECVKAYKSEKQAGLRLRLYQVGLCLHIHQAEPYLPPPLGRAGHNFYTAFSSRGGCALSVRMGTAARVPAQFLYRAPIFGRRSHAGRIEV